MQQPSFLTAVACIARNIDQYLAVGIEFIKSTNSPIVDLEPPLQLLLGKPPVELSQEHLLRRPPVASLHRLQGGGILIQSSRHLKNQNPSRDVTGEGRIWGDGRVARGQEEVGVDSG